MTDKEKLELIQDFTSKKEVQDFIDKVNNSLMEFNILKITGMGTQEIKHSHLLAWMFGDNEHKFQYKILDSFLQKVIKVFQKEQSKLKEQKKVQKLKEYLSTPYSKRNIKIHREKDDIDLLIVDETNKIVITIENKVFAPERVDGEDGGQLKKYEDIIKKSYPNGYDKYFIFLTNDLRQSQSENIKERWLRADYQMISDTLDILMETNETDEKTKLVLESYIDLLKRSNIVEDKELKRLCNEFWKKKENREAIKILHMYNSVLKDFLAELRKRVKDEGWGIYDFNDKGTDFSVYTPNYSKKYKTVNTSWNLYFGFYVVESSIKLWVMLDDDAGKKSQEYFKCIQTNLQKTKSKKRIDITAEELVEEFDIYDEDHREKLLNKFIEKLSEIDECFKD